MANIQKLYQNLKEGKISKNQFLFQLRKDSRINSLFTPANSYEETVRILKNKGLLMEIKEEVKENIFKKAGDYLSNLTKDDENPFQDITTSTVGKWTNKTSFDDFQIGDTVAMEDNPELKGKIGAMWINDSTGERVATVAFSDGETKKVNMFNLEKVASESNLEEDHSSSLTMKDVIAAIGPKSENYGNTEKIKAYIKSNKDKMTVDLIGDIGGYYGLGEEELGDANDYLENTNEDVINGPTKKTLYWIMIEKNGKRFYLGNAPHFSSEEEAHDYAKEHNVKNYSLKAREEMVDDNGRPTLEEGVWTGMMKGVRGSSGPWSVTVIENGKVVEDVPVHIGEVVPAHYEYLKKNHPDATIRIEDSTGQIVWSNQKSNESEQPIKEGKKLSPEGLASIENLCQKLDLRVVAQKLVNAGLKKLTGGMVSSNDLPDTATFANGLDEIESTLEDQDYQLAWDIAQETAQEMLGDEGFGDLFEIKGPKKGIDQVNPYEYKKGVYYELECQKEGAKDTKKAINKVLKNLNKNPKYYSDLFSGQKADDSDDMKEATPSNFVDKKNGMTVIKESISTLISEILSEE